MTSMLEEWKKTHEDSYTWETLQKALRVIGNYRLATNLEEHRLKDKQGHYYNLEVHENWTPRYITCTLTFIYHQSHSHVVGVSKLQEPSTVKQSEPDISAGWIISLY